MNDDQQTVDQLVKRARRDSTALGLLLERYRAFLLLEAQHRIGRKLATRCDPADVVQERLRATLSDDSWW